MTVTYTLEVSTARLLGFPRLLAKWKGSIYKLMYRETIVFLMSYYLIMLLYRVLLDEAGTKIFEKFATYCRAFLDLIPITFVMGFYVSIVITRWWNQYMAIPFPDRVNMQIATFVKGTDERSRLIRRSLTRYVNLMSILVFRNVAKPIMKRFPTMDHLIEAGILTVDERLCLEETPCAHGNWLASPVSNPNFNAIRVLNVPRWTPSNWFMSLVSVARQEGRITDDYHMKMIIEEMLAVRGSAGMMFSYDWISVPLVYTQVVTLAVYCFVVACLFGRQYLFEIPEYGTPLANYVDYYFPLFTTFQFFFYMGWLKVAEELICAYGDDDDDFDINWCIDRNVQTSYMMVDDLYNKHPALTRDAFWNESHAEVPYTEAAADYKQTPFIGSAADIEVPAKHQEWAAPTAADETQQSVVDNQSLRKRSIRSQLSTNNNTNRTSPLALDIEKLNDTKNLSGNGIQNGSVKRKTTNATVLKHKLSHLAARHKNSHLDVSSRKMSQISGTFAPSSQSSFRSRSPSMQDSETRVANSVVVPHPNAIEEYNIRKQELLRTEASAFAVTYEIGTPLTNNDHEDNLSILSALVSSAANSPKPSGHRLQRSLSSSGGRESERNRQEMRECRQSVTRSVSQPVTDNTAYDNQAIHHEALEDAPRITESINSVCQSPTGRKLTTVSEEDANMVDT